MIREITKQPKRRRGRDKSGLTRKQRLAITIVAGAKSRHQGVLECERKKIITADHYYRQWMHERRFVFAINAERTRIQGEHNERREQQLYAYEEAVTQEVIDTALSKGADKMRAIEVFFGLIGVDTGRGNRFKSTTHIQHTTNIELRKELEQKSTEELIRILESKLVGLNRIKEKAASASNGPSRN